MKRYKFNVNDAVINLRALKDIAEHGDDSSFTPSRISELVAAAIEHLQPDPGPEHRSTTHRERYFHLNSETKQPNGQRWYCGGTVYFRRERKLDVAPYLNVHTDLWYVGVSRCDERDEFDRRTGRAHARRRALQWQTYGHRDFMGEPEPVYVVLPIGEEPDYALAQAFYVAPDGTSPVALLSTAMGYRLSHPRPKRQPDLSGPGAD